MKNKLIIMLLCCINVFNLNAADIGGKGSEASQLGNGVDVQKDICTICLEELGEKDLVSQFFRCHNIHRFHAACVDRWVAGHDTCPCCRGAREDGIVANPEEVEMPIIAWNPVHLEILMATKNGFGANLRRVNLSGVDLSEANLSEADLSEANLSEANLSKADLWRTVLIDAKLIGSDLNNAKLIGADFMRAHLIGAHLMNAKLIGSDLNNAKLIGADLSNAYLKEVALWQADLSNADLSNATLIFVNLNDITLSNTKLAGTRFIRCLNFSPENRAYALARGAILED